jgi:hypothetical protein
VEKILIGLVAMLCAVIHTEAIYGQDDVLAEIVLKESAGLARSIEYIVCNLQIHDIMDDSEELTLHAEDSETGQTITCQIFYHEDFAQEKIRRIMIIFPVSIAANERKIFNIKYASTKIPTPTDLKLQGEGLELKIENKFYLADLTKSMQSAGKSHESGQLCELFLKMGFDQLLFRTQNRIHWAPNFRKKDSQDYQTIAGWEKPQTYNLIKGPYSIQTERQDLAPGNPEIVLSASYKFYASLPYFRFFSLMEVTRDTWLTLLRNDEMTMDSLFTHVAFQRLTGELVDLSFDQRYELLKKNPIENEAPWLCFYHQERQYGFASIRILYDNRDQFGNPSPTCLAHTKISDGSSGGKYWNRRLIHDIQTFVPRGSRYMEENAYLVFKLEKKDKFKEIIYWAKRLQNPVVVNVFTIVNN